jgi:hypothetical protein
MNLSLSYLHRDGVIGDDWAKSLGEILNLENWCHKIPLSSRTENDQTKRLTIEAFQLLPQLIEPGRDLIPFAMNGMGSLARHIFCQLTIYIKLGNGVLPLKENNLVEPRFT